MNSKEILRWSNNLSKSLAYLQDEALVTLIVTGSALNTDIYGGPKVCQQGPDGNPSPLQCYQPSQNDLLDITVTPAVSARYAYITNFNNNTVSQCAVDPATGLLAHCVTTGSGFSGPAGDIGFLS